MKYLLLSILIASPTVHARTLLEGTTSKGASCFMTIDDHHENLSFISTTAGDDFKINSETISGALRNGNNPVIIQKGIYEHLEAQIELSLDNAGNIISLIFKKRGFFSPTVVTCKNLKIRQ